MGISTHIQNPDEQSFKKFTLNENTDKSDLKATPGWYQELSDRQIHLLHFMFDSVQDDYDWKSSNRIRKLLHLIGLNPVPSSNSVRKALKLSQGHELAFLWFLLDICYQTFHRKSKYDFSMNETLLMMCIAHLDMITTMRSLDKILPRTVTDDKRVSNESYPVSNQIKNNFKGQRKLKLCSAYFEPIPKPKPQPITCPTKFPVPKIDLHPYQYWNDPCCYPRNEENRWFTYKSPNPAPVPPKRTSAEMIVHDILDLTLKRIESSSFEKEAIFAECLVHRRIRRSQHRERWLEELEKVEAKILETLKELEADIKDPSLPKYCKGRDIHRKIKSSSNSSCSTLKINEEIFDDVFREKWVDNLKQKQEKYKLRRENEKQALYFQESLSLPSVKSDPQFIINDNPTTIRVLLKQAIEILAKDPQYMLASLPNAYKLPILSDWIRCRYNFKPSRDQRQAAILRSQQKWSKLIFSWPVARPPRNRNVCPFTADLTWDYRDRLGKITELLREEYDQDLKLGLIEINKDLWQSFESSHCNPRFREIFYAYSPGAEREFHHFRPWKIHEHKKNLN